MGECQHWPVSPACLSTPGVVMFLHRGFLPLIAALGTRCKIEYMLYTLFLSNAGVPALGLAPVLVSLFDAVTSVAVAPSQFPVISEVGGGWYKFSYNPTDPMVGVVDAGITLAGADRYKPVQLATSATTAFGSVQVTLQVNDAQSALAVPDVEMVVFSQDQTLLINSALTNSSGQMTAMLNPGQYVLRMRKDGYNFAVPQTLLVVGPTPMAFNFTGTAVGDIAADLRPIVVPFNPSFQPDT